MEIYRKILPLVVAAAALCSEVRNSPDSSVKQARCKVIARSVYMQTIKTLDGIENPKTVELAQAKADDAKNDCLSSVDVD